MNDLADNDLIELRARRNHCSIVVQQLLDRLDRVEGENQRGSEDMKEAIITLHCDGCEACAPGECEACIVAEIKSLPIKERP